MSDVSIGTNTSFSFHNVSNVSSFNINVTETDDSDGNKYTLC